MTATVAETSVMGGELEHALAQLRHAGDLLAALSERSDARVLHAIRVGLERALRDVRLLELDEAVNHPVTSDEPDIVWAVIAPDGLLMNVYGSRVRALYEHERLGGQLVECEVR